MKQHVVLAALALIAASSACGEKPPPPAAPALAEAPAGEVWISAERAKEAEVKVEPIGLQDVDDTILTSGRVAFEDVKVGHVFSPVTGQVVKIMALLGQHVKKGDPLTSIQSPDIGQASSDLGKADADVAAAERDYKREKELWEKHATSQKDFETAEDTFRKAKAEKERALQKAYLFRSGNVDTVTQTYTLPAPTNGEVLMRNLSPGTEVQGQYSGTGSPQELFTIGEVDEVWVMADLYELDLSRVHVGAPATVKVVAYPGRVFTGKVDWVSGMLDPTSRTAKVRCTFSNSELLLKPEMYATVAISVDIRKALALPKGSVLRLGDDTVVFVQEGNAPDGRLRFRRVPVQVDEGEGSQWLPIVEDPKADPKDKLVPGTQIVTQGAVLLSGML